MFITSQRVRGVALFFTLISTFLFATNTTAQIGETAYSGSDGQTILSPTAASLSTYGELPVNHFRGIPGINIPIHSIQEKNLPQIDISLSYNSEATRSTDIPDWVGQGWSLNAGGVITRVVNGIPDELSGGFIFNKNNLANNLNNYTYFQNNIITKAVDSAPDDFYYNFGGTAGQLFLDQVVSGEIDIRTYPQKPYKITFSYGTDSWTIITEDGTKYTFSKAEKSDLRDSYSGAPSQVTTAWYLTKIESPYTANTIDFYYANNFQVSAQSPRIEEKFLNIVYASFAVVPNDRTLSINNSINRTYLDSIKTNTQTIVFSKGARTDSYSTLEKKLEKIEIKTSNEVSKSFDFSYDDCALTNCTSVSYKRLFLKTITEKDGNGNGLPPFEFEYNSTPIPSPLSKNVDHWGYYNGASNSSFIPFVSYYSAGSGYDAHLGAWREADPTSSQAGILTKVVYPTGGHTSLEYEPHTFSKALKLPVTINELTKTSTPAQNDLDNTSTYKSYSFTIDGSTSKPSAVDLTVHIEYCEGVGGGFCPTTKPIGGPDQWVRIINTATSAVVFSTTGSSQSVEMLSNGNYELRVNMQLNDPNSGVLNLATASMVIYEEKAVTNRVGGGNRIKRMVTHDGVSTDNDIEKNFEYEFSGTSTGAVYYQPTYLLEGYGYIGLSSVPNRVGSDNKHVGYSKVKVYYGGKSENIYQTREFVLPNYMGNPPLDGGEHFLSTENLSYHYGLLSEVINYDSSNNKVSEAKNTYDDTIFSEPVNAKIYKELPYISYKSIGAKYNVGAGCPSNCQITTSNVFVKHTFLQRIPWLRTSQETATTHDGLNSITSTKKYFYEDHDHLQVTKTEEINSLTSEKRVTTYEYAHDQYSGMETANMLSQPYSVLIEDGAGTDLSKSWIEWTNNSSISPGSKWRLWKQWTWNGTGTISDPPGSSNAIGNSEVTHYDTYGNVLEVKDAGGIYSSNVYTEDAEVLIGGFTNTLKEKVYAHSFAYDGLGDWVFKNRNAAGNTFIEVRDGKLAIEDNGAASMERDRVVYDHGSQITGTVIWEFDVTVAESDSWGIVFGSGGTSWNDWSPGGSNAIVWAAISNEEFKYYDKSTTSWVTGKSGMVVGDTYAFKIVMDSGLKEIDYYIDGELVGENVVYQKTSATGVREFMFATGGNNIGVWYLDNVRIYPDGAMAQSQEADPVFKTPLAIKDASGSTNRFEFDNFGRLHKSYNANGELVSTNTYYYSLSGNSSYTVSDPNYVEIQTHDPNGVTKSISYLDGLGRETQTQLRGSSTVITAETLYDDRGLPEAVSRPVEGTVANYPGYYAQGLMSGGSTFIPTSSGTPLPGTSPVHQFYAPLIAVNNDEDFAYSQTQYEDSPLARVEKTTLPGISHQMGTGKEVVTSYGLNTTETFSINGKTWGVNTLSKTITEDPSGKKTITYTDGWGQTIVSGTDMDGNNYLQLSSSDLVTYFEYDIRGNLIRVEDPRGLVTTYTYNALGQLNQKKLADQTFSHQYRYDDKGRLRFHRDPVLNGSTDHYYYTKYDNFDRVTDIGKRNTSADFDDPADINNASFPTTSYTLYVRHSYDGTNAATGARNLKGRLTRKQYRDLANTSDWGYTWYSYNDLGLVEWVIQRLPGLSGDKKITYTYDKLGRLTQMGYNVNTSSDDHYFWYEYDELGRLSHVYSDTDSNPSGRIKEAEYIYLADGQVKQLKLGNSSIQTVDYTYTAQGWLDQINSNNTYYYTTDKFGLDLDYNFNGNISVQKWEQGSLSTPDHVQYAYTYDNANRLTAANYSNSNTSAPDDNNNGYDVSYTYDKSGNMLTAVRKGQGSSSYPQQSLTSTTISGTSNRISTYGVQNGPTSPVNYTVVYNANGNMTQNRFTGAVYNWRNLPNQVTKGSTTVEFAYDAEGNRVRKEVNGGIETHYVRGADGQTLAVYENGTRTFVNLVGSGGQMIGMYDGSERRYFLKDHLGTVRTTVDQNGNVDGYHDFYPFGQIMPGRSYNTSNPDDLYKFTGHERDDEGGLDIDYMGARNYDSIIGKFIQVDPLADIYSSLSPYTYVANNPLNAIDPDGRLIIFINGMHGGSGGRPKYWEGQDEIAINYYNDHNNIYLDGSIGGTGGFPGNMSPRLRKSVGRIDGRVNSSMIFSSLAPGEKIRVITHSMGGAYSRGFMESLMKYARETLKWSDERIDDTFVYELDIAMFNSGSRGVKSNMKNTFQAGHDSDGIAGNEDMWVGPGTTVRRLNTKVTLNDGKNIQDHSITAFDMQDLIDQIEKILQEDE